MTLSIATAQSQLNFELDIDTIRTMVLRKRVVGVVCDTDNDTTSFEVVKLSDGTFLVQCTEEDYQYWCSDEETAIQLWLEYADDKSVNGRFWEEVAGFFGMADSDKYIALHR